MLGHKSATMTLDLYGHLFPDQLDQSPTVSTPRLALLCTRADIITTSTG